MAKGTDLYIGDLAFGKGKLLLPDDCGTHTFAAVGQRGSGKSSLGMVMADEMFNAGIPWAAIDRVGNWRGLKFKQNGKPANAIVCFGGKNADLPFEPLQGEMIAEAVARSGVTVVIDCYGIDLANQQRFVRDFCRALEKIEPVRATHIFFEETAEYAPEKPLDKIAKECLYAVASLFLLGRNWGYGATALLQRPADVSKKVISQAETLFMLRTSGSHDMKALRLWQGSHGDDDQIEKTMKGLPTLEDGEGYVWSPKYLDLVAKFKVRQRETFHPGETRKGNGERMKQLEAADVSSFVSKLRREMTTTKASVPEDMESKALKVGKKILREVQHKMDARKLHPTEREERAMIEQNAEIERLKDENTKLSKKVRTLEGVLADVKKTFGPQYELLSRVFSDLNALAGPSISSADAGAYEDWLARARKRGCGKMLEVLIQTPELTKDQLGLKAGVSPKKSTWRAYMSWFKKANLIEVDGDMVRLKGL